MLMLSRTRALRVAPYLSVSNAAVLLHVILTIAAGAISTFLEPPATSLANGIVTERVEPARI